MESAEQTTDAVSPDAQNARIAEIRQEEKEGRMMLILETVFDPDKISKWDRKQVEAALVTLQWVPREDGVVTHAVSVLATYLQLRLAHLEEEEAAKALARTAELERLAGCVGYGGNPEHKKTPGDFNLIPPLGPRQGKSLCDAARIFSRDEALKLLQAGLRKGLVSDRMSSLQASRILEESY